MGVGGLLFGVIKVTFDPQKSLSQLGRTRIGCQAKNGGEISWGVQTRLVDETSVIQRPASHLLDLFLSIEFALRIVSDVWTELI